MRARLTYPASRRLRRPQDFDRVYAANQRAGDGRLLIVGAPNNLRRTRFGMSVSRRHGKSVARHRIKRLLREACRLSQWDVPEGFDLVLIPRAGAAAGVEEYRESLVRLSRKLARRVAATAEVEGDRHSQGHIAEVGPAPEGA